MSLQELSADYAASAALLRDKLMKLRSQLRRERDPAERLRLCRKIDAQERILTEMNALAELTARYYERGYYRDAAYTL